MFQRKFRLHNLLCFYRSVTVVTTTLYTAIAIAKGRIEPSALATPGGGGTPLYGLYRYVRPQRVWFFSRFRHK